MKQQVIFDSNAVKMAKDLDKRASQMSKIGKAALNYIKEGWIKEQKAAFAKFNINAPYTTPNSRVRSRGGALRSSVRGKIQGSNFNNMSLILRVGTPVAPAAVHEYGRPNPIKPKGKWLKVPLKAALTGAGRLSSRADTTIIGTTRSGKPIYSSSFGRHYTRPLKSGQGYVVLARKPGKRVKKRTALFVLLRRVPTEARLRAFTPRRRSHLHRVMKKRLPRVKTAIFRVLNGESSTVGSIAKFGGA